MFFAKSRSDLALLFFAIIELRGSGLKRSCNHGRRSFFLSNVSSLESESPRDPWMKENPGIFRIQF